MMHQKKIKMACYIIRMTIKELLAHKGKKKETETERRKW